MLFIDIHRSRSFSLSAFLGDCSGALMIETMLLKLLPSSSARRQEQRQQLLSLGPRISWDALVNTEIETAYTISSTAQVYWHPSIFHLQSTIKKQPFTMPCRHLGNKPRYTVILKHQRQQLIKYNAETRMSHLQTMKDPTSDPQPDPLSMVVFLFSENVHLADLALAAAEDLPPALASVVRCVWHGGDSHYNKLWINRGRCCMFGGLLQAAHVAVDQLLSESYFNTITKHVVLVTSDPHLACCLLRPVDEVLNHLAAAGVGIRHYTEVEWLVSRVDSAWFEEQGIEFSVCEASPEEMNAARAYAMAENRARIASAPRYARIEYQSAVLMLRAVPTKAALDSTSTYPQPRTSAESRIPLRRSRWIEKECGREIERVALTFGSRYIGTGVKRLLADGKEA